MFGCPRPTDPNFRPDPNQFYYFIFYFFSKNTKTVHEITQKSNTMLFLWKTNSCVVILWYQRQIQLFHIYYVIYNFSLFLHSFCGFSQDSSSKKKENQTDRPCLLKRGGGQPNNLFVWPKPIAWWNMVYQWTLNAR